MDELPVSYTHQNYKKCRLDIYQSLRNDIVWIDRQKKETKEGKDSGTAICYVHTGSAQTQENMTKIVKIFTILYSNSFRWTCTLLPYHLSYLKIPQISQQNPYQKARHAEPSMKDESKGELTASASWEKSLHRRWPPDADGSNWRLTRRQVELNMRIQQRQLRRPQCVFAKPQICNICRSFIDSFSLYLDSENKKKKCFAFGQSGEKSSDIHQKHSYTLKVFSVTFRRVFRVLHCTSVRYFLSPKSLRALSFE